MQKNSAPLALSPALSIYDDDDDTDEEFEVEELLDSATASWVRSSILPGVLTQDWDLISEKPERGSREPCAVCLEDEASELDRRQCCGLPVCQACFERYVRAKVGVGVVHIECPNPLCDRLVEAAELTRMQHELVRLFHRRLVEANSEPHRKTCPNCCVITELEPQSQLNDDEESEYDVLINCTACRFDWCFRCHGPQHDGLSCAENRVADSLLQKWAQGEETDNVPTAQQCPKCKVIDKNCQAC